MSQAGAQQISWSLPINIVILLISAFISFGICCSDIEWKCNSGECIPMDEACDGEINCSDGSDETAKSCIQENCPSFAFRCAYGACVIGTAECNDVQQCADNSDEISALCRPDDIANNTNCEPDHFHCLSGERECILMDKTCDGYTDCLDKSDETVEVCGSIKCPQFAFQCGYGACISIDNKCDGEPDCRDGSDEAHKLCGTLPLKGSTLMPTPTTSRPKVKPTTGSPTTSRPKVKPTTGSPTTSRPKVKPSTESPTTSSKPRPGSTPTPAGCRVPTFSNGRIVYESKPDTVISPGESVSHSMSIIYQCNPGYTRIGPQFNICVNSSWFSNVVAVCIVGIEPRSDS